MSADAVTGQVAAPAADRVELADRAATELYRVALRGAVAPHEASPADEVVWIDGDSELLVRPLQSRLVCQDALVLAGIPVSSAETGDAEIVVAFAVGAPGLVMVTESLPRGPQAIVSRWGESLIAAAWDALMRLALEAADADASAAAGPRLPTELRATRGSLGIITRAAATRQGEPI